MDAHITTIQNLKESGIEQVDRLIGAASNPRDKALIAVLGKTGMPITQAIRLEINNIDFKKKTLTIINLKERIRSKCLNCGELLGKRHYFCPACGKKVDTPAREKVEQRRERVIPVDHNTLQLLDEYLNWRRQFPYRGPLVFPFSRQRGWQLVERIGRRAGIERLHPHSFRHLLATTWVTKGLDMRMLQILLGHSNVSTKRECVDSGLEQLKSEYNRLWVKEEDEG